MNQKRTQIIIAITAFVLALHAFVLLFLFIFYHSSPGTLPAFTVANALDTSETIFFDRTQSAQEEQLMPQEQEEQWAQLNPRAGTLGNSMEMPDEEWGIENNESSDNTHNQPEESSDAQDTDQSNQDAAAIPEAPMILSAGTYLESSNEFKPQAHESLQEKKSSSETLRKKSANETKKIAAQKIIANITRGYLENLNQEGNNLIKTLGGDPNKRPTAQQLKYERYLAKIQWCLQNAHSINNEKCQSQKPIQATMKLYFTLNRMGKMNDFKIIQSSGTPFVDKYITSLFEFASSSFPPLPDYMKEDPYPLFYTVMINWNMSPTSYMGFTRN